jgi:hypothetical protein
MAQAPKPFWTQVANRARPSSDALEPPFIRCSDIRRAGGRDGPQLLIAGLDEGLVSPQPNALNSGTKLERGSQWRLFPDVQGIDERGVTSQFVYCQTADSRHVTVTLPSTENEAAGLNEGANLTAQS